MKSWYPPSYSEIARGMLKKIVYNVENSDGWTYRDALMFFENSYRPKLSRYRMAKAFGRLRRAGKIKGLNKNSRPVGKCVGCEYAEICEYQNRHCY